MAEMLRDKSVAGFLDDLASKAPTPGGGSVAALNGSMAAGLISMVCAIAAQKNLEEVGALEAIQQQSEELRRELYELAEADSAVFHRLSIAYKLPRTTEADAASRQAAIQAITREATDIPLQVARAATALLPLCTAVVNRCGRLLVSDVGVAATLARATTQSALLNVEINLSSLEDQDYVRQVRQEMSDLMVGQSEEVQGIIEMVLSRISK
jgi:formiminotetrahydrofolate cyclodeaminase